jgi:hypothetical protein
MDFMPNGSLNVTGLKDPMTKMIVMYGTARGLA